MRTFLFGVLWTPFSTDFLAFWALEVSLALAEALAFVFPRKKTERKRKIQETKAIFLQIIWYWITHHTTLSSGGIHFCSQGYEVRNHTLWVKYLMITLHKQKANQLKTTRCCCITCTQTARCIFKSDKTTKRFTRNSLSPPLVSAYKGFIIAQDLKSTIDCRIIKLISTRGKKQVNIYSFRSVLFLPY